MPNHSHPTSHFLGALLGWAMVLGALLVLILLAIAWQ